MATTEIDADSQNYRDFYPAIHPSRPENSQSGKVAVITGASRSLGQQASRSVNLRNIQSRLTREQSFAASFAHTNTAAIALIGRSAGGLAETEKLIHSINPNTKSSMKAEGKKI
ncbi:uncharacterized protein N7459_000190 [Penicillium hispanicum]|uniref:uncharacterized protein n=1 Tax=Penicillium hispanicum TaxID=1080232 RepID=UPI00254090F2|nr:uncharacterized protein N7459_000190 [Penicillium hispanicum]KAJ5593982.1 hypothetical protein N7459_000190 [Penicillium hispanicum]